MFLTAIGNSGSWITVAKLCNPTQVGCRYEVRVLQRHDHRAHDRVPGEGPEDQEGREQEQEGSEAAALDPGRRCAPGPSPWRRGLRRAHRRIFRLFDRGRHGIDRRHRASGRSAADGAPTKRPVRRTGGLSALLDRGLRGAVGRCSRLRDVGVLVREHRLDDRVERVVDALGRCLRLGNQRLLEDPGRERLHLLLRHVDVRLDPAVRQRRTAPC